MSTNAKKTEITSGLSLAASGDLSSLWSQPAVTGGKGSGPLELELALIDEDPNPLRTVFDPESLEEMAETIRARGVKTPISVRPNPEQEGRYLINHGARRVRASKLAGKTTIPGFIDLDYTAADQVIENLQRDSLTPREIADFIGRALANGKKKGEIAKAIGKSPAFVTQHVTLLDLPEPVAEAFNRGRCRDVTVINELVTAYKKKPKEVAVWLDDESQEITRGSVKLLREFLDDKEQAEQSQYDEGADDDQNSGEDSGGEDSGGEVEEFNSRKKEPKEANPDTLKKAIVQVRHDGRTARLLLNRRPPSEGYAWLQYEDDGQEFNADLNQVQLVAVLEG